MTARYDVTRLPALAGVSPDEWRRRMGMSSQTYRNYCRYGLNEKSADRFAVRTGLHPFTVWPEITTVDVQVAGDGTGGVVESLCPVEHRNRMRVTVEVD